MGILIGSGDLKINVSDCFFEPQTWDDASKAAYRVWVERLPDGHPSKADRSPWERATRLFPTNKEG